MIADPGWSPVRQLLDLELERFRAPLQGIDASAFDVERDVVALELAAYRDGHEGVMAKDLGSAYNPGVRGKSWLKLKHVLSLDLAIVAAEWGYGRRHGWLSNYHLAALDTARGEFRVVFCQQQSQLSSPVSP